MPAKFSFPNAVAAAQPQPMQHVCTATAKLTRLTLQQQLLKVVHIKVRSRCPQASAASQHARPELLHSTSLSPRGTAARASACTWPCAPALLLIA
eukprot:13834-Heterococcus_DN1.PRE.2